MKTNELNKSFVFPVVLEQDEDVWRAYVPELEAKGAATWGRTKDEALRNIQDVIQMITEEMVEEGQPVPQGVTVFDRPVVAVSV
jgi:predicted RNase H-like HicB family nuclease